MGKKKRQQQIEMHMPSSYFVNIPAAPELAQARKIDIGRLRDIRKRLDTGYVPTKELEVIALECLDELVELCSGKLFRNIHKYLLIFSFRFFDILWNVPATTKEKEKEKEKLRIFVYMLF